MGAVIRLRRLAAASALLAALPLTTAIAASPASASCVGPELRLAPIQRTLEPGTRLTVRGVFFIAGCDDTPPTDGSAPVRSPGKTDVPLRVRQAGEVYELGRADAGGPDGPEGRYGRIRWDVVVPEGLEPGYARLKAPQTNPMIVAVGSSPAGTYEAVAAAIRDRDVDSFRDLRAHAGAGAEIRLRGCRYGDQRPGRIVNCLADAVEEGRLRLPESADRVLTLRQIVRSDHPEYDRERRRREVRKLALEVSQTIDRRVRPRAIASAQVDDAVKQGTPLDVYVVRVRGEWQMYWMETRTRIDERR